MQQTGTHKRKIIIVSVSLVGLALLFVFVMWYTANFSRHFFVGKTAAAFAKPTEPKTVGALSTVSSNFGPARAQVVEQMYRWETGHMQSKGFQFTNAPGMEAVRDSAGKVKAFPYGWESLKTFWLQNPKYAPIGIYKKADATGIKKAFLIFRSTEAGMMTLANWLETHRIGNWKASDEFPAEQADYESKIASIVSKITNSL